jgi:hypothetical protein
MEHILALYERPYDPARPLICLDERPCKLHGEVLEPLPMKPGQSKREDHEYQRNGVCTVFIAFEPATGRRWVLVRERRTKQDYALFMQYLAAQFPAAEQIDIVQDNLNTHHPGSFYAAFKPQTAFALAQRFQMHYTPRKASWLNMVELELAALSKQCLDRRIGDIETLRREVVAWVKQRNDKGITVTWQFTKEQARETFKRFYPTLQL